MNNIALLKSSYYPYHLTWEELNDPASVLQNFLQKWDLQDCRLLLRRWEALIGVKEFGLEEGAFSEIKYFINDFEKLIEAIYILRLQFHQVNDSLKSESLNNNV